MLKENACIIMSDCAIEAPQPILSNDLDVSALGMSGFSVKPPASWGGARANSGGARPNCGGPQPGSGRPRKMPQVAYAPSELRWFCIRLPNLSDEAVLNADVAIRNSGFETLYPQEWVPPVAAHRTAAGRAIPARSERLIPLLRSYALVRFDRTDPSWRILAAFGQVLGATEWPTPIPDSDIASLRKCLAANDVKYPDADPEPAARVKKRWVSMLDGLAERNAAALQMEPA